MINWHLLVWISRAYQRQIREWWDPFDNRTNYSDDFGKLNHQYTLNHYIQQFSYRFSLQRWCSCWKYIAEWLALFVWLEMYSLCSNKKKNKFPFYHEKALVKGALLSRFHDISRQSWQQKMVPSGIEPLIPALLARCLNQLGQGTKTVGCKIMTR